MEKIYFTICIKQIKHIAALLLLLHFLPFLSQAQNRNLSFVYSGNIKGGAVVFGNTLMYAANADGTVNTVAMNGNSVNGNSLFDNGNYGKTNMQYVDIDGNTGEGAGTKNASSADLVLPAGSNRIKLARLYWGGRIVSSDFKITDAVNQRIKIRKGVSGAYHDFAAAQIDKNVFDKGLSTEYCHYQAFVDITELVQQQGDGTYTVGDGTFSKGTGGDFGNYGAWSIVVVYENPTLGFNSVRVIDGYQQVYSGGGTTSNSIKITGLNIPAAGLNAADAQIGIMCWEGDARFNGDFFKINNNILSNGLNQSDNPWNSTITNNGVPVTSKNPNYSDQMGIDIDQFHVGTGYGILPNATSILLQFGTTQDQYFCGLITAVIKMKESDIKITKTVADANNNKIAEAGEILTYSVKGKNFGGGNTKDVVLTDSLPSTMTFVANSLKVNYSPGISIGYKTDVAGDDIAGYNSTTKTVTFKLGKNATAQTGGYLAPSDSFEVEFKVKTNALTDGIAPPIINVARVAALSDNLENFIDDGTAAIIGMNTTLKTTVTSFNADLLDKKNVLITWSSSMEFNCSRYDIEKSTDGYSFKTIATKNSSGTSTGTNNYSIPDDVTNETSPIVYYRLIQIDLDGIRRVSEVVFVVLKISTSDFKVSPNPFINHIKINIDWDKNETTVVKVFNATGAEIISKSVAMIQGLNDISIDGITRLPAGLYIIQFTKPYGKLLKQVIKL